MENDIQKIINNFNKKPEFLEEKDIFIPSDNKKDPSTCTAIDLFAHKREAFREMQDAAFKQLFK